MGPNISKGAGDTYSVTLTVTAGHLGNIGGESIFGCTCL